jgi:hypothetical protein
MDQGVQDYANVKMENATAWMVLAHVILDGKEYIVTLSVTMAIGAHLVPPSATAMVALVPQIVEFAAV